MKIRKLVLLFLTVTVLSGCGGNTGAIEENDINMVLSEMLESKTGLKNSEDIQAEDENLSLNIKKNFVKYPHDSYLISQNLFVFITEINHNHLFLENRYYSFSFRKYYS